MAPQFFATRRPCARGSPSTPTKVAHRHPDRSGTYAYGQREAADLSPDQLATFRRPAQLVSDSAAGRRLAQLSRP